MVEGQVVDGGWWVTWKVGGGRVAENREYPNVIGWGLWPARSRDGGRCR